MSRPDLPGARTLLGVSLKMYFDYQRTLAWSREVAEFARNDEALLGGDVALCVFPDFLSLAAVAEIFAETPVSVGAQNIFWEDAGAYTGEVSGAQLRAVGAQLAEIGHAERKRLFGESAQTVALKTAAAVRNGLVPVICVGESGMDGADDAVRVCLAQLDNALSRLSAGLNTVIVAYEPEWAIGADAAAAPDRIRSVCAALGRQLAASAVVGSSWVIYGGSAGPGLLSSLGPDVHGLFLGRSAHDPGVLRTVVDEAVRRVPS